MKNLIAIYPNVARAYEIARATSNIWTLYYDKEEYPNGHEDCRMLTNFFNIASISDYNSIKVHVSRPVANTVVGQIKGYETIEEINKRVELREANKLSSFDLGENSKSILKTAYERLNLTAAQIFWAERISAIIAKLDNKKLIEPIHVAEALNYVRVPEEYTIYHS
jgi:hypothetical protein